ncbi:MAG: hypothetical protein ACE5K0_01610, partial [Candidatus Methanofastidiosia archaeon]
GYQYVFQDPKFCNTCHLMNDPWEIWQESEHNKVTCHRCHEQSLAEDIKSMVYYIFFRPEMVMRESIVKNEKCEQCHVNRNLQWIQIAETVGHKVHYVENEINCVDCHSISLHELTPPEDICMKCHRDTVMDIPGMGSLHCTTCHNYLSTEEESLEPDRKDCLTCHEKMVKAVGPFPKGLAPMKYVCSNCHIPHKSKAPVKCTLCHDVSERGYHSITAHKTCVYCHKPHTWIVEGRVTCEACHVDRQDHNPGKSCVSCHGFG